jgi:hypothetical protein
MQHFHLLHLALVPMPLSSPISRRALKHSRAIQIDAFARDDGLWDLDAHISDIKTRDVELASGTRSAGTPIHDLFLRVTINTAFTVVAVDAASDKVPYPGYCDTIAPAYSKLIGLNLVKGFRKELQANLGDVLGCTHLSQLAVLLPTVAIQAFAGEVFDPHQESNAASQKGKPFQLDRCHALRTDGAAVAKYYPSWAIAPVTSSECN